MDYEDTFSPMVRVLSGGLNLARAVKDGMKFRFRRRGLYDGT